MRNIAKTIKLLRLEKNLTQQQLADLLKIKRSALSMYEADQRIPSDDVKEAICDFFNVDMNYLFGKTNTRNSYRETNFIYENDEINEKAEKLLDIFDSLSNDQQDELISFASYLFSKSNPRKPLDQTLFEIKEEQNNMFEERKHSEQTHVRSKDEKNR